ncbi:jouberin [Scleropages formosus]|uniref:Osteoclast-stimulating factor 1 n=2 Tax=Scleropages formosus TaxID=113540 RepID=A0A8C9RNG1_SCLFO|nr:jouberin [Scleropages formosus]
MPAGESEARAKTKARFDEVLKRYTDPPSEKKKSRKKNAQQQESIVLETLKKQLDLNKDSEDDGTILKNTYRPDQGSPRYIKNKLREKELSEKVNNSNGVQDAELSKGKKKSKRDLPKPASEDDNIRYFAPTDKDGSGPVSEANETLGTKVVRRKKGKEKNGTEGADGLLTDGAKAEDELLQEYQQQIVRQEARATKKSSSKMAPGKESGTTMVVALNNDVGKKKKKKLKSHDTEVEPGPSEEPRSKQRTVSSDAGGEGRGEQEVQPDEQNEREETLSSKKRKKKKIKEVKEDHEAEAPSAAQPALDDSLVLGVHIHRTDQLKTDILLSHPMVKVHVIDEVTGQYVKKEDSHRPVSSFYEQDGVEHVLPIMTQPFDFKKNKSTIPVWDEQIVFNERFGYFLQDEDESPRVTLFFEVLDFMSMDEAKANTEADRHERGFRKIAWAFLKLVGANGVLNVGSKLRLQLYCPPPRAKRQPHTVEVVEWWRRYPRRRYASTLYVAVKGLKLPEHVDPSIRSMMALQQERGSTSYSELQDEVAKKTSRRALEDKGDIFRWSRVPGQVCRIPNKPMLSFRGGQMGCLTLRFSHAGRRLAAGCADRDAFPVVVYEIPSGKVLAAFNGHLSIVYDLCWSRDDLSLLSASSDGTVRIWDVERMQSIAKKVLPHPSFVYATQYHPVTQELVVTGGYDCLIRVWNVNVRDVNGQLLHEFEGHKTFINALCFDSEGMRMYSGDNGGSIVVWNSPAESGASQRTTQLWNVEREIGESDLKGISISGLEVHPNGRRLLIHAKDSIVRVMDLRILVVKKYVGITNYRERIRSTFSPCGSFIFSGSEDGMAYVWNADTGDRVAVYTELCYPRPLRDVAFHPHENMVAFCAFGDNQPVLVYIYDRKVAQMEVESMKGLKQRSPAETGALRNTSDTAAFPESSTSSTVDRFARAARLSLKMQHVKQKLDSVLNRNPSAVDHLYEHGGISSTGWERPQEASFLFNTMSSDPFLPAPSVLSPHSKVRLPGAPLIPPQPSLGSSSRFSPVGQRFSHAPSLQLQTGLDDRLSSSLRAEADSFVPVQQTVISLYDYSANRSDELSVCRGDVIQVLYKDNDNWWFGRLGRGQQGYFPANYVVDQRDFEEELSHAMETNPSLLEQLNQSAERSTPTKTSAVVSASGELRFISEHDSDSDIPSGLDRKKKRKAKRPPGGSAQSAPSDPEVPSTSGTKRTACRPLPKRGESSNPREDDK